jgi:hypothetical protein
VHALFAWIESSALSVWVRESPSLFGFPTILALHTVGMGFAVGFSWAIDLRILGVASRVPLKELKRFVPIIWSAFWLNAASGVVLLIGYPTKALTNPLFYAKLTFIAFGVVFLRLIHHKILGPSDRDNPDLDEPAVARKGRSWAIASLGCWTGAIATGRLLAYTYVRLMSL